MLSKSCAEGWDLVQLGWTSTQIRNQMTTRVQITFRFKESTAFAFYNTQRTIRAQHPNLLPVNPNIMHEIAEETNNRKRVHSSPTESEYAPKKRQCSVQTICTGPMLDQLSTKSREF